jgi:hypothetical protein
MSGVSRMPGVLIAVRRAPGMSTMTVAMRGISVMPALPISVRRVALAVCGMSGMPVVPFAVPGAHLVFAGHVIAVFVDGRWRPPIRWGRREPAIGCVRRHAG